MKFRLVVHLVRQVYNKAPLLCLTEGVAAMAAEVAATLAASVAATALTEPIYGPVHGERGGGSGGGSGDGPPRPGNWRSQRKHWKQRSGRKS